QWYPRGGDDDRLDEEDGHARHREIAGQALGAGDRWGAAGDGEAQGPTARRSAAHKLASERRRALRGPLGACARDTRGRDRGDARGARRTGSQRNRLAQGEARGAGIELEEKMKRFLFPIAVPVLLMAACGPAMAPPPPPPPPPPPIAASSAQPKPT